MAGGDNLDDGLDYGLEVSDDDWGYPLAEVGASSEEDLVEKKDEKLKKPSKKRIRNDKLALKKKQKVQQIAEVKRNVAKMDPPIIADYMAAKIKRKLPDLSSLELNERLFSQEHFKDTSDFSKERNLETLPSFLQKYFKATIEADTHEKLVVILVMSAIRVCDIHRELMSFPGGSYKLIKKNNIKYDIKAIESKKSSVAVTTCGRLKKLLDKKVIDKSKIVAFVVDSTYLDSKVQSIWDIDDTLQSLKELIDETNLQLYLF